MNAFWKKVLDVVAKPELTALETELTNEQAVNIAKIEATVAEGGNALEATVSFFIGKAKSTNPIVEGLESLADVEWPDLETELSTELGTVATKDVPTFYASGLAWLSKLISEV